jgi:hypothetical protein
MVQGEAGEHGQSDAVVVQECTEASRRVPVSNQPLLRQRQRGGGD